MSELWQVAQQRLENAPLVRKYFGQYLERLVDADQTGRFKNGWFVKAALNPEALESSLALIEKYGQTKAIVDEVGSKDQAPDILDARLLDAWAEIRLVVQLCREGYSRFLKTKATIDLEAILVDTRYVFQVKRINARLSDWVSRKNPPDKRSSSAYGLVGDIHDRLDIPAWNLFWSALEKKNEQLGNWKGINDVRSIVIVTNEGALQDRMIQHICCQQIRWFINQFHDPDYGIPRNFDELRWIPDMGNGVLFQIGNRIEDTLCFADPGMSAFRSEDTFVMRVEINLDDPY